MAGLKRGATRMSGSLGDFGGVKFIFLILMVTKAMLDYDSGGTAAVLVTQSLGCEDPNLRPKDEFGLPRARDDWYPCMDQVWKGYLGAAPYIGLCFACVVSGPLLTTFSEKHVLIAFTALNAVGTFMFAYVVDKHYLVAAKFVTGFAQAPLCIYGPIWVSLFAPIANKTLWYGLMQSSAAIGNLIGYAVCGFLLSARVYYQWGFRLQAFYLTFACLLILIIPRSRINSRDMFSGDVSTSRGRSSTSEAADGQPDTSAAGVAAEEGSASSSAAAADAEAGADSQGRQARSASADWVSSAVAVSFDDEQAERAKAVSKEVYRRRSVYRASMHATMFPDLGLSFTEQETAELPPEETSDPHADDDDEEAVLRRPHWCLTLLYEQVLKPLTVLRNPIFSATQFALCSLFFVVTAVQYWVSEFFITVFQRDPLEVTAIFVFESATAPILGVVLGSLFVDKLGGTTGTAQVYKISKLTTVWGLLATLAGALSAAVGPDIRGPTADLRFYVCATGVWIQLFFGGAMLPAVSGMSLEAVPLSDRANAGSLSQLLCNIFGFSLGVSIPGYLSQAYGLRPAMQVSFAWAGFGCLGMLAACFVAQRNAREALRQGAEAQPPAMEMPLAQSASQP